MEGNNAQVVDEFPHPPVYYQLFTSEKKEEIPPPDLSELNEDIYELVYSGMFATSKLPFAKPSPEMLARRVDFKSELKA
jgi:hypothetical protein